MGIFKRGLSFFLSLVLIFSMIPGVAQAAEAPQAQVDNGSLSIGGENSFGTLLSSDVQNYQQQTEKGAGAGVTALTVEAGVATVELRTLETAIVVVGIYSQDGMQLLLSGKTEVQPEDTIVSVALEGDMPQYFFASAYLVDIYDYSPLCSAYESVLYTQEMQELLDSTMDDYDADRILNLDNDPQTNFAVYKDAVLVLEHQDGVNTLISTDEENATYVIENPDDSITQLQTGDIFSLPCGDYDYLIVKVDSISVSGTTATIVGAQAQMEEVFSHVKVEVGSDSESAHSRPATRGETEESWTRNIEADFDDLLNNGQMDFGNGYGSTETQWGISGSAKLELSVNLKYFVTLGKRFFEIKAEDKLDLTGSFSGTFKVSMKLPEIEMCVYGISIGFEPKVILEVKGEVTFTISVKGTVGLYYSNEGGFRNLTVAPEITPDFEVKASIFFGIDLGPTVELAGGVVAEGKLSIPIGFRLDAKLQQNVVNPAGSQNDCIHGCKACVAMELFFVVELSVELSFLKMDWLTVKSGVIGFNRKLTDMYWSIDEMEFDVGKCPYLSYRITVQVKDQDGAALAGVEVMAKDTGEPVEVGKPVLGTTDRNGMVEDYLCAGNYVISVEHDGTHYEEYVVLDDSRKVVLDKMDHTDQPYRHWPDSVDDSATEEEKCGKKLRWTLENGILTISGKGKMYNWDLIESYPPWYEDKDTIRQVVIEDGAVSIGQYAFYGCENLTIISIPESVSEIGRGAFYWCTRLKNIEIPEAVTVIEDYVFAQCYSLPQINIPEGVSSIGSGAFIDCHHLDNVTIPATVKEIKDRAFCGCRELKSIRIPEGITTIEEYLFNGCSALTSVELPETVTVIGPEAFTFCGGLTDINIPDSVTTIGDFAFSFCYSLSSVTIPGKVTYIGVQAFYGCSSLRSVAISDSVVSIGAAAFSDCTSLTSVTIPGNVLSISDRIFSDCTSLTSVEICEGLKTIGSYAFCDCIGLTSFRFPDSVTDIGSYVFDSCTALTAVQLGQGVTTVGRSMFSGCDNLQTVTVGKYFVSGEAPHAISQLLSDDVENITVRIQNDVTYIGEYAFTDCEGVTSVLIPDSVTSIGVGAFSNCYDLTSIVIPDSVASIGSGAFIGCTALTSVRIGDGVTNIGIRAFSGCTGLTSVTIGNAVISIGDGVFFGCTGLSTITIPEGVIDIGNYAFQDCSALTDLNLPNSLRSVGAAAFGGCSSLTSITIGSNMVNNGNNAGMIAAMLHGASNPITLKIRDGVTGIANGIFMRCTMLETIEIPASVTNIGVAAFIGCSGLRQIVFAGSAPTFGNMAFRDIVTTVCYPAGDPSWTQEVRQNYGGIISWEAYDSAVGVELTATATSSPKIVQPAAAKEPQVTEPAAEEAQPIAKKKPATRAIFGGEYTTQQQENRILKTASFSDLVPGAQYVMLALVSLEAEDLLAAENLLAICQGQAAEDGTLVFTYVQRIPAETSYVMACGASNRNLQDAVITFPTMYKTGQATVIAPEVRYEGQLLTEGQDYALSGSVNYSEAGTYTCYIRGIYDYTGLVECTYTVANVDVMETENYLYLKLYENYQITSKLHKDLYVDLNGHDLTGTVNTNGFRIYGMDSVTDSYRHEEIGHMRLLEENGKPIAPVKHFKSDISGSTKRYLAIVDEKGYSFHRFYIGITHQSLKPAVTGIGYKALFCGDEMVTANLDSIGFTLGLGSNVPLTLSKKAEAFTSGKTFTLRIDNYDVQNHGETNLSAAVMLKLTDGTVIETDAYYITLRSLLETLNLNYTAYSAQQLAAVAKMIEKYPVIRSWKTENLY